MEKMKPPQVVEKLVDRIVEVIKQVPVEKIVEVKVDLSESSRSL
jgi:hypothetical protein